MYTSESCFREIDCGITLKVTPQSTMRVVEGKNVTGEVHNLSTNMTGVFYSTLHNGGELKKTFLKHFLTIIRKKLSNYIES